MVNICHFCHKISVTEESKYGFEVDNYINLIAQALGIDREDKFKNYKQLNNIDQILEDTNEFIKNSPYTQEQIINVLINEFS